MKAFRVRVRGRVQRVGYRRFIVDEAQGLGLAGYVRNLPDGSVEVFVQGGEEDLRMFLEAVRDPPLGEVRGVEVEEVEVKPDVEGFRIIYGELAEELQEGFGGMQEVFMQYWREFRDYRGEFKDFRGEFRDYREEFRGFVDEFRDYREEFREFAVRTDENFRRMEERYGEISEKLTVILETLIRESRETREMINESLRLLRETIDKLK